MLTIHISADLSDVDFFALRETCLLIDPNDSSSAAKQYVALVVGEWRSVLLMEWFCETIDCMGWHVDLHGHAYNVFSKAIKGVCGTMLKKDYWGNNFVSIAL